MREARLPTLARLFHIVVAVALLAVAGSPAFADKVLLVHQGAQPEARETAEIPADFAGTVVATSMDDLFAARRHLHLAKNDKALVVLAESLSDSGVDALDKPVGELRVFWNLPSNKNEFKKIYDRPPDPDELDALAALDLMGSHNCSDLLTRAAPKASLFYNLRARKGTKGKNAAARLLNASAKRGPYDHDLLIAHFDGAHFRFHDGSKLRPAQLQSGTWLVGCATASCKVSKGASVGTTRPLTSDEAFELASTIRESYMYDGGRTLRSVLTNVSRKYGYLVAMVAGTAIFIIATSEGNGEIE